MLNRSRRAAVLGAALAGALAPLSARAVPVISTQFASRFQIAASVGSVPLPTQMAWGPGGRLYVTRYLGESASYAFNPATGVLSDRRLTGVVGGFGLAFANHATPDGPARNYMYICRNANFEGSISRLSDDDNDGIWGEAGEVNVEIVRGVPYGDHTLDQIQINNNQLFIGMGARTNNGRTGDFTGQNFHDTPAGPVSGGFGSGQNSFTYGETSYNGAIATIRDLTSVPNVTSAAQLRNGPNGTSGSLLFGRDAFLPGAATAQLPYISTANDKLVIHSAGTRNPYGLALDSSGNLWFTNNHGRADSNGDGTSTPHLFDELDDDISNDVHDQLFRALAGGDYRYDNENFRGSPGFPATTVVSATFDNLDSLHPNFGNLHDPANPDGLGPSSSSNGLDFGTLDLTGILATDAHEYALISRFNPTIMEMPPGTDALTYQDVVVVDPQTGEVRRLAEGFSNTIDVISDGNGGFLVADWGPNATIYRITPRVSASRWNSSGGGTWSNAANWSGPVPDGLGAVANFTGAIQANAQVTVDSPKFLGTLNFDNLNRYTIAGTSTLTIDVAAGFGAINVIRGSHTIATPVNLQAPTRIDVQNAGSTLTMSGSQSAAPGITLTKAGPGALQIRHLRVDHVQLLSGKTTVIANGTSDATSRVKSLTIAGGGTPTATLDLSDNAMVIDYDGSSPIATIASQIDHAHNGGAWDQDGITSSLANANQFGIGYAERSRLSTVPPIFGTVDATTLLLRFTRYGDANLDGLVNVSDFNSLAANFNQTDRDWSEADFNYDGTTNIADFNLLAGNFGLSASPDGPTPDDWAQLAAAVPEPSIGLLLVVPFFFHARRTSRFSG